MEKLNYQHLFYFWNVAREGSVTRASEKLRLAQPTISGQLAIFEGAIGARLFRKEGRGLALTETGRTVFNYAEEIFSLGRELTNALKGHVGVRGLKLNVGVVNALPKLFVYRLIAPALEMSAGVQVTCYEDKKDRLLAELALHGIDLVIADAPATSAPGARVYSQLIGEALAAVFGAPALAARYRDDFPRSLKGAPILLQTANTELRRAVDDWFDKHKIRPQIRAEIEDSALLKTFGAAGAGMFVAPRAVRGHVESQYGVEMIGELAGVSERFYAITTRRKVDHPAITKIMESARGWLQ
ncbi:MAG: LysR family transcriptional regulator [Methylocystis sp.]|nr:LysR family transcriptional regulator [Methylocystis sp.]